MLCVVSGPTDWILRNIKRTFFLSSFFQTAQQSASYVVVDFINVVYTLSSD